MDKWETIYDGHLPSTCNISERQHMTMVALCYSNLLDMLLQHSRIQGWLACWMLWWIPIFFRSMRSRHAWKWYINHIRSVEWHTISLVLQMRRRGVWWIRKEEKDNEVDLHHDTCPYIYLNPLSWSIEENQPKWNQQSTRLH